MANPQKLDILAALELLGTAMVREAQAEIKRRNKVASGNLLRSINYEIKQKEDGSWAFKLNTADYGRYVELGRKPGGKFPPVDKIKGWIETRGIRDRNSLGKAIARDKEVSRLAFVIGRSIARIGIPATPIFQPLYKKYSPILTKKLEEEIAEEIERFVVSQL